MAARIKSTSLPQFSKEGRKEGNIFGDKKEFELDVRRNYASL